MKPQSKAALYIAKLFAISILGGIGAFLIVENLGIHVFLGLFVIGFLYSILKPLYELKVAEYASLDELNELNGK
jgi:hypothetical protein